MKKYWIIVALVGLLSACVEPIVDITGSISGVVKDYTTGQTVGNCQVAISPVGSTTFTSANGGYTFSGLQPGTYTLTFTKIGYLHQTTTAEVISGKITTKDILLEASDAFTVSHSVLDFGDVTTALTFSLDNTTAEKYDFAFVNEIPWLSFSQTDGTIQPNNNLNITAKVDRSLVGYGSYDKTFSINYTGSTKGNVVIRVVMHKVKQAPPTVETLDATDITANSFSIGGYISSTGGEVVTEYGHCWSFSPNPNIDSEHTSLGKTTESLRYTSQVYCSLVNTTVYVRAYAKNSQGISYGQEVQVSSQSEDSSEDGDFAGGTGTAYDPYQIRKAVHMLKMKDYPSAHFILIEDIDMEGNLWTPIPMNTSFDGKNHTIYNLTINPYDINDDLGLFSTINTNAVVKNLTLHGPKVNFPSKNHVGAIAGACAGTITNCHVVLTNANAIVGNDYVGGLVGLANGGKYANVGATISSCTVSSTTNSASIIGSELVGGAVGDLSYNCVNTISNVHVSASIAGIKLVGGIVGRMQSQRIEQLSFEGTITALTTAGEYFGGLVGELLDPGGISSSKANAIIEGNPSRAGGLVGGAYTWTPFITACYSQGQIIGNNNANGIVGHHSGTCSITYCYTLYNSTLNESESFSIYDLVSQYNSPINIAEIMRVNCSSEASQYWDFDRTWTWQGTANGKTVTAFCPKLKWEQ